MDGLDFTFRVVMAVGTLVQTAFVALYLTRPWRASPVSRALMAKSSVVCAFFWALDFHWLDNPPRPIWFWLLLAILLVIAVARQFWVLVRVDRYLRYTDYGAVDRPTTTS